MACRHERTVQRLAMGHWVAGCMDCDIIVPCYEDKTCLIT